MPKLDAFLETIKSKRLQRERAAAINERCRTMASILDAFILTQDLTTAFPSVADVCEMNEVKAIIQGTPVEVTVNRESFAEVEAQLPTLCDEWRSSKDRELVLMMNAAEVEGSIKVEEGEEASIDVSCLQLATTWFSCRDCTEPISYPRVLAHSHAIAVDFRNRRGDEPDTLTTLNCDLWNRNGDRIKFHVRAHEAAKVIVKACGRDPDVTTAEEMNAIDPILECTACYDATGGLNSGKLAMRWRRAVRPALLGLTNGSLGHTSQIFHSITVHHERSTTWATLSPQERLYAENNEKMAYSQILPDLACVHCRLKTSLRNIKDHVRIG
jgi:hypothetical protein